MTGLEPQQVSLGHCPGSALGLVQHDGPATLELVQHPDSAMRQGVGLLQPFAEQILQHSMTSVLPSTKRQALRLNCV